MPAEMIRFACSLPHVALRTNSRTNKPSYRAKLVREYQEQVWVAGYGAKVGHWLPWEKATITYHWYSTHPTDEDNIIATMKPALDVLQSVGARPLGIIVNDSGATVRAEWHKESKRSLGRVEICIERLP